jgi:hypothetical protein
MVRAAVGQVEHPGNDLLDTEVLWSRVLWRDRRAGNLEHNCITDGAPTKWL